MLVYMCIVCVCFFGMCLCVLCVYVCISVSVFVCVGVCVCMFFGMCGHVCCVCMSVSVCVCVVASFPAPAQLFVICSMEKWEEIQNEKASSMLGVYNSRPPLARYTW